MGAPIVMPSLPWSGADCRTPRTSKVASPIAMVSPIAIDSVRSRPGPTSAPDAVAFFKASGQAGGATERYSAEQWIGIVDRAHHREGAPIVRPGPRHYVNHFTYGAKGLKECPFVRCSRPICEASFDVPTQHDARVAAQGCVERSAYRSHHGNGADAKSEAGK